MPDSIEDREPTSRKARRLKQRQQPTPNSRENPQRRSVIKGLGGTLLFGAVGVGLRQLFSSPPKEVRLDNTQPTENPKDEISSYRDRLVSLNNETYAATLKDPDKFKEIAPRIADLATAFFCQEMGYDPARYSGKFSFEWNNDYIKRRENSSGCIDTTTSDDQYAYTKGDSQEISFNLTKHLYGDVSNQTLSKDAAIMLFNTTLHELHHVTSPVISLDNQNGPPVKQRGLGLLLPRSSGNKPGLQCYIPNRVQLEEAIVEHSTQKMLDKLRISPPAVSSYNIWVERYQKGIINKLFHGDYTQLLKLHQQTKQDDFFRLIGQKLGASSGTLITAGEDYAYGVITKGTY